MQELNTKEVEAVSGASLIFVMPAVFWYIDYAAVAKAATESN